MSELEERLDDIAEAWKPTEGDKLVGTVQSVEMFDGKFGPYPLLIVEAGNGKEIAVHAFHTVLKSELSRKRPQPGDRIGLKYLGMTDRGYEGYRVLLESQKTSPVDWDQVAASAADEYESRELTEEPPDPL